MCFSNLLIAYTFLSLFLRLSLLKSFIFCSLCNPDLSGKSHDTHKCLERKNVPWIDYVRSTHIHKVATYPMWWTQWCSGYHARLKYAGRRGFESCSGHEFFSHLRDVCRKPLVSYLHLSFIAQVIYILFTNSSLSVSKGSHYRDDV